MKIENTRLKLEIEQMSKKLRKFNRRKDISSNERESDGENRNINNRPKSSKKSKSKDRKSKERSKRKVSSHLSSSNPLTAAKEEEVLSNLVDNI